MDGSNDYINLSDHDSLNITGDIWISAWVKLNEIESGCCDNIVARGHATSPNGEVSLKISVGKYMIGVWNGISYFANYTVPAGDVGQWVHISGGHNGTGWSLYRNGVLVHSLETSTGAIWVNDSWAIGARSTGSERFLNGSIDEVAIYNRSLSDTEITDLYARGRVADSSSAGADGQIVGPVSIEGMMDNALYFDGSNDYINVASINPTQEITVEAWVKSETSTGYAGVWQIVSKYSAYILGTSGTGSNEMCFIIRNAADWQYGSCYTVPDPENWHHFAGTYNSSSGEKYLYVDGVLKGVSITSGTIVADTGPIHIGHRENQIIGSYHFSGIIDEVAIWNRSLSASEIYQHYLDSNPFMGPDRKSYTYYTNASGHTLDVRNSRYLQYRGYFGTSNGSYTPYLNTVFINYTAVVTDASGDYNYSLSAPASEGTYPVIVNATYTGLTGSATDNIIVSDYLSDGSSGTWCNSSDKCFFIHDSGGTIKARFDARGYVDVKAGYYPAESSPVPDDNSFIIKDSGGNTMLYINDSGGLVTAGNFYRMITMSPGGGDDFIIKNSSGDIVGYIDGDTGNMNFLGKLNYNSDF